MNDKFIYDEKSSKLYAPDGSFFKNIHCPKALHWNQLIAEENEDRWRGCSQCSEKVFNLDTIDLQTILCMDSHTRKNMCLHASSDSSKVIFLKDLSAVAPATHRMVNDAGVQVISTAWSIPDITRAVGLGYWPDVRLVEYDTKNIWQKISVGQHEESGKILASADNRASFRRPSTPKFDDSWDESFREEDKWVEVVPFTRYYPYYKSSPIAAYLIPKDMADGTSVIVADPIEDIPGSTWSQGDTFKFTDVPGIISDRRVILQPEKIEPARRNKRLMG